MDCSEVDVTNVFRTSILMPTIKIVDIYATSKCNLSPDEFCILLFSGKGVEGNCKFDLDLVNLSPTDLEDFQAPPIWLQTVIVDLFMNVVRYEHVLEAVSMNYLNEHQCRKYDDLRQIMVLVYVLVYRICHLSFGDSVDCFVHFKLTKMLSLVSYLLREETINLFYRKGCSVFEEEFVESKIVLPLLEATPFLEKLHDRLKEQRQKLQIPKKGVTIPVFMNVLNHPRKLSSGPPPTPEDLPIMRFARQVPKTNYIKPSTERKLESLRAANRLQAMNLLIDADRRAPSCSRRRKSPARSKKQPDRPITNRVRKSAPNFKPVDVKQTAASVLRECARIVNDEAKELKRLKELSEGGHDPLSILKLQEEERQREKEEELKKIQEKHLLALLTREGAFIAKQSLLNDVKLHAENVRKEKQELYERLEKWRQDHTKEMAQIVEKCREIEQASREAFNSMIDEKRQRAAEVSEESRQLKEQLSAQREEETRRKIQLIQEIKTIQSLRSLPLKDFDPTESSGLGLLCEMSLAELKERLFWMKMKAREVIENRKASIGRQRERQKNLIANTRKALEEYKVNKLTVPPSKVQRDSSPVNSPAIEVLRKKLEERRAFRLQK